MRKLRGIYSRIYGYVSIYFDYILTPSLEQNAALDKLLPAVQGDYKTILDSGKGLMRETFTKGTRVTVLEDITTWANAPLSTTPVYWLTG